MDNNFSGEVGEATAPESFEMLLGCTLKKNVLVVSDDCMVNVYQDGKGMNQNKCWGVEFGLSWVNCCLLEVLSACGCSPLGPWPRIRPLARAVALDWLSKSF